jgi:uncharacterized membrane protein YhaH (DUF805 family)
VGNWVRRRRGGFLWFATVWTLVMVVIAVVLATEAASTLYNAQQACFFDPAAACPSNEDPAVARLTFAFLGVPLVWIVGLVLSIFAWALHRRHGSKSR